ncbi:hypothetical protein XJ44_03945 [Thermosipho affectus]|uniref:Uncharacterized protein n=1 Tax=Thermosipho affectus TaxID=660294 RepID=A0ABX3II14_9BACT|nr:hypothetical protein [Thermosipho affectus]ONN27470.1 hypothetical protein XJ44_03945 [Thermosipho affectus]
MDRYDILESVWNVACRYEPDEIDEDQMRDGNWLVVWKFLPLDEILSNLDLLPEEFEPPNGYASDEFVYFKLSFNASENVICLSLHLPEYSSEGR